MEVTLYNFSKRNNSTKVPTDTGTVKDVKLKDRCDRINPSFFLADAAGYTYLKAWGWYYFITNVAYDINGAQYVDCLIDVLGTWKESIKATSAFVEYSTSNYDTWVNDPRIAQEESINTRVEVEETIFRANTTAGCYLISTLNDVYGVTTYACDKSQIDSIVMDLITSGQSVWGALEEIFSDVSSCILSCRYVPVDREYFQTAVGGNIILGDWDSGYFGYITTGSIHETVTISIPWYYSDFRRNRNYTRLSLGLPFIGVVDLDTKQIINEDSIFINMWANGITGVINYGVWSGGKLIGTYSGTFGREVPIATNQIDAMGVVHGALTQGGAVIGGALAATPAGEIAAAGTLIASVVSTSTSLHKQDFQTMGGFSGGYGEAIVQGYHLNCRSTLCRTEPSELTTLYGRPCYKVLQIGSLTGYVNTVGFSIDISAPKTIKDMINEFMDKGVYLE